MHSPVIMTALFLSILNFIDNVCVSYARLSQKKNKKKTKKE